MALPLSCRPCSDGVGAAAWRLLCQVPLCSVQAVQHVAKKCRLKDLLSAIQAELRTFRLNFKTARRERAPRRLGTHVTQQTYRWAALQSIFSSLMIR